MKLEILSEYGKSVPQSELSLIISQKSMMDVVHDFLELVDSFFKTGKTNWIGARVDIKYGNNIFSILVRCGVQEGPNNIKQPKVVVADSWDDSVEVRLDVPFGYRQSMDWSKERIGSLQTIATQVSMQLGNALRIVSSGLISKMKKSGAVRDFP